jgi:hypothetical protein
VAGPGGIRTFLGLADVGLVVAVAALPFIGVALVARGFDDRVRLSARELMAGPEDIGGATVTRDEPIRAGTGWSREMTLPSGQLTRATVFVIVFDTEADARSDLAGSACDGYYRWSAGSEPATARTTVSAVGDTQPVGCRFNFGGGRSQQYSVWGTTRNVRIDVLGLPRSASTGDPSNVAAVRAIVATEIERIDRVSPRH